MKGLEPPRLSAPDPKSGAATITPHPLFESTKVLTFCHIRKFRMIKVRFGQNKATSEVVRKLLINRV
ncbi:MAG: hypothetical protein H6Q17_2821 [Bacteroidetes bacterium]|nr:hypothetical protein [Bacteroidota bacterium]